MLAEATEAEADVQWKRVRERNQERLRLRLEQIRAVTDVGSFWNHNA